LASRQDAGAHVSNPPAHPTNPDPAQVNTTTATPTLNTPTVLSVPIGVGIDSSRYGHHASFLRADLQPAAADLNFVESALGHQQLRQRLDAIADKHGGHIHFHIRLDIAGRYADNLLAFLHELAPRAHAAAWPGSSVPSLSSPSECSDYRKRGGFWGKKRRAVPIMPPDLNRNDTERPHRMSPMAFFLPCSAVRSQRLLSRAGNSSTSQGTGVEGGVPGSK
jgi:hypothetical protein